MTKSPELKGSSFTLSALHLVDGDIKQATDHLKEKVSQAPSFFASAPVVIDITHAGNQIDFNMSLLNTKNQDKICLTLKNYKFAKGVST